MKRMILFVLILTVFGVINSDVFSDDDLVDVLLLNSYHDGYAWSNDTKEGIKTVFDENMPDYHMRIEHIDSKNNSTDEYFEELYKLYKYKFERNEFDVIISADDNALKFLLRYGEDLFGQTPVFFCGVNTLTTHDLSQVDNFYGVVEKHSIRQTIELAKSLNDDLEHAYLVVDNSITGRATKRDAASDLEGYRDVELHIYDGFSFEEILRDVETLNPEDSIVIQSFYVVDEDGATFPLEYTARKLIERSAAPVYGIFSFGFGTGSVGGKFVEGYTQGTRVANMVIEYVTEGKVSGDRYIIDESHNRYYFDYQVMDQLGLRTDALPEPHIMINRPISFYEEHRQVINIFIIVLLFLVAYVYVLRRQIRVQTERIRATHSHLMESEQMASLGRLVAGIAHEVNTPLSIGVSLATYMVDETDDLNETYDKERLTKNGLKDYLTDMRTSAELMSTTMVHASELINSFKQVAVDQAFDEKRRLDICKYMNEIVSSLKSELKHKSVEVNLNCVDELIIYGHSGAIYQILLNLIMNSLKHGFHNRDEGVIDISVSQDKEIYKDYEHGGVCLVYRDDGHGMTEEVKNKIFEPFYTTRRDDGGSGLGMHIVMNLVHEKLHGTIECNSQVEAYTEFIIRFPIEHLLDED